MFGLKKKFDENEKVKKFKELWANPKYRSLILLGMYFVFFIGLGIMFRTSSPVDNNINNVNNTYNINDILTNLATTLREDYQYSIQINNITLIKGNVNNNTNSFSYENEEYLIINNNIYKKELNNLILVDKLLNTSIDINYLTLENILNNIENVEPIDKQLENNFYFKYNVNLSRFINSSYQSDDIIKIMVNGKKDKVSDIKITNQFDSYIIKVIEE